MKRVIFILLFCVSQGLAQSTYYVATNGNDAATGGLSDPWKTIQHAVDNVSAGDSILIRAGTYRGERGDAVVNMSRSGVEDRPIVITNYENEVVRIDATDAGRAYGIKFSGSHYIHVSGITISEKNAADKERCCILFKWNASHITIQDCDISGSKVGVLVSKLWTEHNPTYISIIDCKIYDNDHQGIKIVGTTVHDCHHITIAGNDVYSNGYSLTNFREGSGIYLQSDHCLIENNAIHHNASEGLFMASKSDSDVSHHCIIRNNRIFENGYNGIMLTHGYTLVHDNQIHDNGQRPTGNAQHGIYMVQGGYNVVFNNTIYGNFNGQGAAIRLEGNFNVIKENVMYDNGYSMASTNCYGPTQYNIIRKNLMYSNETHPLGWPYGTGMEIDGTEHLRLYNNVIFDLEGYGLAIVIGHRTVGSSHVHVKNNIIMHSGLDWNHIWVDTKSAGGYQEDYNNIYPDKPIAISFKNVKMDLEDYHTISGQGAHSISQDPMFIDPDNGQFHLRANSPCEDAGTFLTVTKGSASGTRIPVEDAYYFTDGNGISQGDVIQLEGQTQTARILDIDHQHQILIVDQALIWIDGQGIALPYRGHSPDMGVFEYVAYVDDEPPSPPTNVRVVIP